MMGCNHEWVPGMLSQMVCLKCHAHFPDYAPCITEEPLNLLQSDLALTQGRLDREIRTLSEVLWAIQNGINRDDAWQQVNEIMGRLVSLVRGRG